MTDTINEDKLDLAKALDVNPSDTEPKKEVLIYLLRMVWQGRFDKMSDDTSRNLIALTHAYMDPKYGHLQPQPRSIILTTEDHTLLATNVINLFFEDLAKPVEPILQAESAPKKEKKKGFFSMLGF